MLKKTVFVIKTNAHFIWVNSPRSSGCSGCQQSECGVGILNKATESWFNRQYSTRFARPNNKWGQALHVGDKIIISASETQMLKTALWLYLFPLLSFFFFAFFYTLIADQWLGGVSDLITALLGFIGLLSGFALIKLRHNKMAHLHAKLTVF